MIRAAQASPDTDFCVFSNVEAVDDAKKEAWVSSGGGGSPRRHDARANSRGRSHRRSGQHHTSAQ